jgi:fructokinase
MSSRPIVVGLGEILWDVFPDGPRFGGAPANFACHVAELGANSIDVHVASGVGRDEFGRRAVELLQSRHVDTSCVAELDRPTGTVLVELDAAGHASYTFAADTAWDNVAWSDGLQTLAANADAVCFGTLAQRGDISRQTIRQFLDATPPDCICILDINLRPPFWTKEVMLQSLELANVLKLNETELPVVAEMFGWNGPHTELAQRLLETFSLRTIALTRGADGAMLMNAAGDCSDLPGQPVTVADTVGAGDAYTAALAIGLLRDLPVATINAWAIRVAAFVCSQPGATPKLPAHLRQVGS